MLRSALIVILGVVIGLLHANLRGLEIDFTGTASATGGSPVVALDPSKPTSGGSPGELGTIRARFDARDSEFVDARLPEEYARGHIPGARNIPPEEFYAGSIPPFVNEVSRDARVVVYCNGGACDASRMVAARLRETGFSNVVVFEAGFAAWNDARFPVEGPR